MSAVDETVDRPSNQKLERALVARVLAGDRESERALYDMHAPRVYRLAYRLTGDADFAMDMLQDVFVRIFDELPRFQFRSALATWIRTVALSTTLNGIRRERRHTGRVVPLSADLKSASEPQADPALASLIERAVGSLGDDLRLVFLMADIEGFTHEEIAGALGISTGASRARLSRARGHIRRMLGSTIGED